ncbi:exonuclease domain-containing protein [Rhodoblastus sp.]|uniref:exonuclease domain-containing protein n=1 Tax=Rhodoblastus sp. TaxID=1962975 RepID=UPI003F95DBD9
MQVASCRAAQAHLPSTVVFYDLETSGLDPAFDQILQIAAIKTDADFCESAPSTRQFSYRARLRAHVVPSPAALLTTGLRPIDLEQGMDLADMMFDAHQLFSAWGPAAFIGYNNLRFDEKFLRHGFFANLLPP